MGHRLVRDTAIVLILSTIFVCRADAPPRQNAPAARAARFGDAEAAYRAGLSACNRGDWKTAQDAIDEIETRYRDVHSPWSWGSVVLRAFVLLGKGEPAGEALKLLEPPPPRELAGSEPAVKRLLLLAFASDGKRRAQALDDAEALSNSLPRMEADVLATRAALVADAGKAERYAQRAIEAAKATDQKDIEVKAATSLALALGNQEQFESAIRVAEQFLPTAREQRLDRFVGKLTGNLGWFYSELGDDVIAENLFLDADKIATDRGLREDHFTWLLNRGNIQFRAERYAEAAALYELAYDFARKNHITRVGFAPANLAVISIVRGDYQNASRYNAEALELKRNAHNRLAELRSDLIEGRIAAARRESDRAGRLYERVINNTDNQSTLTEAHMRLAELYAGMGRDELADGQYRKALLMAGNARKAVKDEELKLSLGSTDNDVFLSYIDFLVDRGRTIKALRVAERARARTLTEGLGLSDHPETTDPREIARRSDSVILSYWLGPKRSLVWVTTAKDVRVVPLRPAKEIRKLVNDYLAELGDPFADVTSDGRGARLYRALVEPAAAYVPPETRVAVIADDILNTLNFETLVVPGTRPHYWIQDVTIVNANALQFVAGSAARRPAKNVLIIGNARPCDGSFPALRNAASEIQKVRQYFPAAQTLQGEQATPEQYAAMRPERFDVIHFVAHGTANRLRPLDSAIILSCGPKREYKLPAREIRKHPLTARPLVTISSCHGAGKRTYGGEGLVGLAWAFLKAGAHEVIAALWEVDDQAAPEMMGEMYRGIQGGADPATALRAAKLKMLGYPDARRYPRYWAPFVLYSGAHEQGGVLRAHDAHAGRPAAR